VRILKAAGLTVGVAGNTGASTEAVLRDTGLGFDIIGSSRGWAASKPAGAFFERMVQVAGLPPAAIAYVGDRLDNDVLPATQAGLRAVFLRRGPWAEVHRRRPERAVAAEIDSLSELPAVLGVAPSAPVR
jgi:FMN phosphatase YigB (HAD superfamily)